MPTASILVINPNSSRSVTAGLEEILRTPPGTVLSFYTGPSDSPAAINDIAGGVLSASACFRDLIAKAAFDEYDGFLISCFSNHPLISMLRGATSKPVVGILEASVAQSLLCGQRFGILSTGSGYRYDRYDEIRAFMGGSSEKFAGLVPSGLGVVELREGDRAKVEANMKQAARKLAGLGCDVIILGCAGMAGMEELVRSGVKEAELGSVKVVDGNKSGIEFVAALVRLAMSA